MLHMPVSAALICDHLYLTPWMSLQSNLQDITGKPFYVVLAPGPPPHTRRLYVTDMPRVSVLDPEV